MPGRRSQDAALSALAHPRRRQMLSLVLDRERSSSELATRCRLSRPAASQHLKVLRETGLVTLRTEGNRRLYRAQIKRLAEVRAMLDDLWGDRLARLSEELSNAPDER
ncbi:MAG: ArsR/SmtB family transcription factor [Solirubrobacteraceae bacterium]